MFLRYTKATWFIVFSFSAEHLETNEDLLEFNSFLYKIGRKLIKQNKMNDFKFLLNGKFRTMWFIFLFIFYSILLETLIFKSFLAKLKLCLQLKSADYDILNFTKLKVNMKFCSFQNAKTKTCLQISWCYFYIGVKNISFGTTFGIYNSF